MHCSGCPVSVFQKRMQRSAVPPPDASSPCWCGDQAMAFTAARCSVYCCTGLRLEWFQTSSCGGSGSETSELVSAPPHPETPVVEGTGLRPGWQGACGAYLVVVAP